MANIPSNLTANAFPIQIKRQYAGSLDPTEVIYAESDEACLTAAENYANSATAYVGQNIKTVNTNTGAIKSYLLSSDSLIEIPNMNDVENMVNSGISANDAMVYKGTVSTSLPTSASVGHTYKVATAGTILDVKLEVNDTVICVKKYTSSVTLTKDNVKEYWNFIQTNIDTSVLATKKDIEDSAPVWTEFN